MLVQLTTRLSLGGVSPLSEFTRPVSMAGANAVQYSVMPFYTSAGNGWFQLQESFDLENWSNLGSAQGMSQLFKLFPVQAGIESSFVRLKAYIGYGTVVLAINLNTFHQ